MNYRLLYKISKQLCRLANKLPRIPLPQKIEKEALDCYYDFVNNDGENGQDKLIDFTFNKALCKQYVIKNVRQKCCGWKYQSAIKDRFDDKIVICFVAKQLLMNNSLTTRNRQIVIYVNFDNQDIDDLTHEIQHYFQHLILDDDKLDELFEQLNKIDYSKSQEQLNKLYLLSKGQYIQQIGSCCKRFFNLYMKSFYKEITFEQFYKTKIEDKLEINIDKLKSSRFENYCKNSLLFLSLIKQRSLQEYMQIRLQILQYSQKQLLQEQNLQKILNSNNYVLMQNLILQNKQDKQFVNTVIQILIENKKIKLLTAIIQHFELFNKIDYNSFEPYYLLLIVKNCKKKDTIKEIIINIADSKNIKVIEYFMANLNENVIKQQSLLLQCNTILFNWING